MKLKLLLEKQIQKATGKNKIDLQKRLSLIQHLKIREQNSLENNSNYDYSKVFLILFIFHRSQDFQNLIIQVSQELGILKLTTVRFGQGKG